MEKYAKLITIILILLMLGFLLIYSPRTLGRLESPLIYKNMDKLESKIMSLENRIRALEESR